jgi:lycopene beta-cyclase
LGTGCATLSLVMRMICSKAFEDKKILLIDREPKTRNDRTWCFWEKQPGFFEEIVYRRWNRISFFSNTFSSSSDIRPYQYKMIRGADFYRYCLEEIKKHDNLEMMYGELHDWHCQEKGLFLRLDEKELFLQEPGTVFNSVYKPQAQHKKSVRLLQHFKGWVIETPEPAFDEQEATMMDFRVHQRYGTTFAYVLPFSSRAALVEYTLFTKDLLKPWQYDEELKDYIRTFLHIKSYKITETETGIIPMTNEKFSFKGKVWNIGTAGGQTKASSGYTFQFIQKHSQYILDCLLSGKPLSHVPATPKRFRFYDNTLLHILYYHTLPGDEIFTRLFSRNPPQAVLRFLDNESTWGQELKIISTLPAFPFLKAALKQL